MTLSEFKTILASSTLPVAYLRFPDSECPEMPFIVYEEYGSNNVIADNTVYKKVKKIQIDLFTKGKDEASETKLENAIAGFPWQKESTPVDNEICCRETYFVEII